MSKSWNRAWVREMTIDIDRNFNGVCRKQLFLPVHVPRSALLPVFPDGVRHCQPVQQIRLHSSEHKQANNMLACDC